MNNIYYDKALITVHECNIECIKKLDKEFRTILLGVHNIFYELSNNI